MAGTAVVRLKPAAGVVDAGSEWRRSSNVLGDLINETGCAAQQQFAAETNYPNRAAN